MANEEAKTYERETRQVEVNQNSPEILTNLYTSFLKRTNWKINASGIFNWNQ